MDKDDDFTNIGSGKPFAQRKRMLELAFRMVDERVQPGPVGPLDREELYAERIESIYRGASK